MSSCGNEFFYVQLIALNKRIFFYKYHTHMASLLCEHSYGPSDYLFWKISSYKYQTNVASRLCEYTDVISDIFVGRISSYK
jgi:hypothetical protein